MTLGVRANKQTVGETLAISISIGLVFMIAIVLCRRRGTEARDLSTKLALEVCVQLQFPVAFEF